MKLFLPIIATIALSAQASQAWSLVPRLYDLDFYTPTAIMRKQQDLFQNAFTHISPRYEIKDTEEKFQVSIDVPGVKMEDLQVSLENDGSILSISGHRSESNENRNFESRFSQRFSIEPVVDIDKFSANLKNGVLTISAPKDLKRVEQDVRKIPVMLMPDDVAQEDKVPVERETKVPVQHQTEEHQAV
jgi:HSP20 family protein